MIPENAIRVLDKGYVRLVDHMGSDISPINAARVSFDKESELVDGVLDSRDVKLINYLVRNNEMAVFRQATVQFEIYMPLMTARQYWKYVVGVANVQDGICLNESSRRYITEIPTFYIPEATQWRAVPENKKQGSSEIPVDPRLGAVATQQLIEYVDRGVELYEYWNSVGFAPEMTRLFLPAYGMYVRCRTTMSLAALIHLLQERMDSHAQGEFQEYARAMRDSVKTLFPESLKAVGLYDL